MKLEYSKAALKVLQRVDKPTRARVIAGINGLLETPPKGDIKAMQANREDFRLRVGKFRVIYHQENDSIRIDEIGARGDIYK